MRTNLTSAAIAINPKIAVPMHYGAIVGTEADAVAAAHLWQFMPVARRLLAEPDPRVIQRYAEENTTPEMAMRSFMVSSDPADHAGVTSEVHT